MRCALAFVLFSAAVAAAQPPTWVTVKGQVVLPKDSPVPVPPNLLVVGAPQCLAKGALKDEKVLVDAKSRGIKNVVVWLRPADEDPKAKFKPGDVDERRKWPQYQKAYEIALERCNTDAAPWYVVPSDRKWYRNWAIGSLLLEKLRAMDLHWPDPDYDVAEQRARLENESRDS